MIKSKRRPAFASRKHYNALRLYTADVGVGGPNDPHLDPVIRCRQIIRVRGRSRGHAGLKQKLRIAGVEVSAQAQPPCRPGIVAAFYSTNGPFMLDGLSA